MKIILEHIGKSFDGREVLKDLDYVFDADRPVVVKGASGTGKTTLLRIIGGLLSPDKGSVRYEGVERGKCRFAPVFQEQRLIDHLNAVENIRLVCRGMPDKMIADELTKLIPESEILKKAGELSGGTARRVEVVRAILAPSDVLLLDEPLTGLDGDNAERTVGYIMDNLNGRLLIASSHTGLFDGFCSQLLI